MSEAAKGRRSVAQQFEYVRDVEILTPVFVEAAGDLPHSLPQRQRTRRLTSAIAKIQRLTGRQPVGISAVGFGPFGRLSALCR
jgi:hypothetical protein